MICLKNKYHDTSRQRRRTLLRQLDNSVMRATTDPDVFLSEVFQLRDELSDLGEVNYNELLTTIVFDALPTEKCVTIKIQSIKDPDLCLEEIANPGESLHQLF